MAIQFKASVSGNSSLWHEKKKQLLRHRSTYYTWLGWHACFSEAAVGLSFYI